MSFMPRTTSTPILSVRNGFVGLSRAVNRASCLVTPFVLGIYRQFGSSAVFVSWLSAAGLVMAMVSPAREVQTVRSRLPPCKSILSRLTSVML